MHNYKKTLLPITLETINENARKWLNIIRFGESGTVIQLQDDCEYRILEIINNPKILKEYLGPYYRKYLLKYLPIDQKDLNTSIKESLIQCCEERKIDTSINLNKLQNNEILDKIARNGFEVGLFISHITPLLKEKNYQPLIDLELLIRSSKNFSVIVFSEYDITHNKFNILVDKCSFLYDHIIRYPLYSEKDAKQFITYYSYHWKYKLGVKNISELIKNCGGYLWLIHQAHRNLRDNPNLKMTDALTSELMQRKLEIIWSKFTESEKEILRKIYFDNFNKDDLLTREFKYLSSVNVIKESNGRIILGIPLLSQVIDKENRLSKFHLQKERILIGKKNISNKLSTQEKKFLLLLISSKKRIISRNSLAQTIWGKNWENEYSDWAIDRLAYRIRKKFRMLGIDENLFRTIKKKGFIFG